MLHRDHHDVPGLTTEDVEWLSSIREVPSTTKYDQSRGGRSNVKEHGRIVAARGRGTGELTGIHRGNNDEVSRAL